LDHEDGGPKAKYFLKFGFSIEQWNEMAVALGRHPDLNSVDKTEKTTWGTKYVVRCHIETPDGRNPCIVTVWMTDGSKAEADFVTAYPE